MVRKGQASGESKRCSGSGACSARHVMRPAQIEALSGTALLLFSALKRGPLGLLAFLGAAALIAHATGQRMREGFR